MTPEPGPEHDEAERLRRLRELQILDSPPEPEFDSIVKVAAQVCGVPIALISLIDADRQWFKASTGLPGTRETSRESSFCTHAIDRYSDLTVHDALADPVFANNPLVTGAPHIRFYAGIALQLSDGTKIGTLCVIGRKPGRLTDEQRQTLNYLATTAARIIELRALTLRFAGSEARFRALCESAPLGVYATDAKGSCTYTNRRWQNIYGMSKSDALADGWGKTLHPDDKAKVMKEWFRVAKLKSAFDMEFRILREDGTLRYVRSVARPVVNTNGDVISHVGSVEDITERVAERNEIETIRKRLSLATLSGRIGVWEYDLQSDRLVWDDLMFQLYGIEVSEGPHSYSLWADALHPDDRESSEQALRSAISAGDSFESEFRIVWPDQSIHHIRASASVTYDQNQKPLNLVGVNWDVSNLRALSKELSKQHELLSVTLQSIGDAVITTDAEGLVNWLNPAAERMTGWVRADAMTRPLAQVFRTVDEEMREAEADSKDPSLENEAASGLNERTLLVARYGKEIGIKHSIAPIRNAARETLGAVIVFHDVTEERKLTGEMSYRAKHDALTGLINRAEFEVRLARVLLNSQTQNNQHAVMYLDLDRFKLVNDACGHSAGDQALKQITKLISSLVRSRDTLARLGGDEFAVILEHCPGIQAKRVAEDICDLMNKYRFVHEGRTFRIGVSIGLVPIHRGWTTTAAIMKAADTSCYAAKEVGGNRVHTWFDSDSALKARQGEMRWATRLEEAIDADRFQLYGQEVHSLNDDPPGTHIELLLRMTDSKGEVVMPAAFLPAAERFHLASRIDRWVLQQAILQLQASPNQQQVNTLLINISGRSVGDRAFHKDAIRILIRSGRNTCKKLCLEVTETSAVTNMADAATFIDRVRSLGVRIALDDFGSGSSSFGYLKNLNVDLLKIDGQFIQNLTEDALDDVTVRAFVNVAQVIGVKTVAEHVEKQEVFDRVKELGIDFAQGYLLHRPEPIKDLLRRLG